jgi:hypothetical protein
VQFVRRMPPESHCELSYASLVADPAGTINRVLDFIGARSHEGVTQFVRRSIRRRGLALRLSDATALERTIGGPMLTASFIVDAMTKRAA